MKLKFEDKVNTLSRKVDATELAILEKLGQLKSFLRDNINTNLTDAAEAMKTLRDQYEVDFNESLREAQTASMLHHEGSIVNAQSLKVYKAAFLLVSVVSVASIVAGLMFGFCLGVTNYRSYISPTQRNTACNMGGILLLSNAGLMWATCAFIPVLLTFCFPLAALLEAYVCQPYDNKDGSSLDGAASYLFNRPKAKLFQHFTPSNILGKCNDKTSYAILANLTLTPLDQITFSFFREKLFSRPEKLPYVSPDSIKEINEISKSIVELEDQNKQLKEMMERSPASKIYTEFMSSIKNVKLSTDKILNEKDGTPQLDLAIATEALLVVNESLWKAEVVKKQALDALKTSVGDCRTAQRVTQLGFLVACRIVSDNMNGLWLSLFCCLLCMFVAIPVTLMLSRYFLRMRSYTVNGQAADELVQGQQQARRIREVRDHILQQSREARCLVMSFDAADSAPVLPAVSADSGSPQLARIIPTAVVRRVGVDDPHLPRGRPSPFGRPADARRMSTAPQSSSLAGSFQAGSESPVESPSPTKGSVVSRPQSSPSDVKSAVSSSSYGSDGAKLGTPSPIGSVKS
ncbi:prominin-1-A-like [Haemaphysalis longicornis]